MDNVVKPKTETFDLVCKYIGLIAVIPSVIGFYIAKISNRIIIKSILKSKNKKPLTKLDFAKYALASLLIIIGIASTSICVYGAITSYTVWYKILTYIVALNISSFFLIGFLIITIYNKKQIDKRIEEITREHIIKFDKEAKQVVKSKNDKKSLIAFFTNKHYIDSLIKEFNNEKKEELIQTAQAGVVLNKELGICISPYALARGTVVFGTTGSGKTNTLELFIKFATQKKQNIIFVNGKGDEGLVKDLKVICKNTGYDLKVWAPALKLEKENKFIYNPFKDKPADLVVSMLMEIGKYSTLEESTPGAMFYKNDEMACISLLCKILLWKQNHLLENQKKEDYYISLDTLFQYSDLEKLTSLIVPMISERMKSLENINKKIDVYKDIKTKGFYKHSPEKLLEIRQKLWSMDVDKDSPLPENWLATDSKIDAEISKKIRSLAEYYQTIKNKPLDIKDKTFLIIYEEYLDVTKNDDKVKAMSSIRTQFRNLRDISGENKIISSTGNSLAETISSEKPTVLLFSLDTKAKKIQSAQVARMLISDLKQNDRIIRMNDDKANLMCIFDEFGSFATEDIVELQEQGRSFGFQIIYAIQTLSNLTKISADFATRVIGNCSTYITHRTRDNKAAEEIANLVATNPAFEGTERESEGEFTGERSVRAVEHYIHHPRQIKQLPDHYALIVTIENGEVTPIAEPIKIDYANIENFKLNKTEKINSEEDNLTEEFKNVGFAQNKARIMAKEHLERRNLK